MKFISVGFRHFRNLEETLLPTDAERILLVGENGQGKTNFLEAVYTLCYGSSFRSVPLNVLCTHGSSSCALSAAIESEEGYRQTLSLTYSDKKRVIRIDGKEIKDRKDLIYTIPCIIFSHDDIEFIRGTPEDRRRFFDQTMSMYDPSFFDDLRLYRMILKQRNRAIKENYLSLLPVYNEKIAQVGLRIKQKREETVAEFNEMFTPLYREVSERDTTLKIVYRPSWKACVTEQDIIEKLENSLNQDMKMQTTVTGIHRDQFITMENDSQFALSGSTGQMRLASLIFRVAQMNTFRAKSGREPVILLDDVLLELDIEKRGIFLSLLGGYSQAFFTFLPKEAYFNDREKRDSLTYRVDEGRFHPHE